jgi:hypothetical protein
MAGRVVDLKVHGHDVKCGRDDATGIWTARVAGVPGFIVSGATCTEAVLKVRNHLPDFLLGVAAA